MTVKSWKRSRRADAKAKKVGAAALFAGRTPTAADIRRELKGLSPDVLAQGPHGDLLVQMCGLPAEEALERAADRKRCLASRVRAGLAFFAMAAELFPGGLPQGIR